ncbi:MAG: hypothetical protein Q4B45_06470 [Coriobacteriia bacterium]|nr:hypothetical protein [Coriobacteriia bacterium]
MGGNALVKLNAERCESELGCVKAAVSRLLRCPAKVDLYFVAAESGVSRSTLYRNAKLRSVVEAGRASQPDPWELIGRLTAENNRLRAALFAAEARIASGRLVKCDIKEIPLVA